MSSFLVMGFASIRDSTGRGDILAIWLPRRNVSLDLHRHVPVDDQPPLRIDAELAQDAVAEGHLVDQLDVGVLRLDVGGVVGDQVVLQRGDAVLAEQRRPGAAPRPSRTGRGATGPIPSAWAARPAR